MRAARWSLPGSRVSLRTVERWRRAWREQGAEGLRSRGPICAPRLTVDQVAELEHELAAGRSCTGGRIRPGPWPDRGGGPAAVRGVVLPAGNVAVAAPQRLVASAAP